MKSSRARPWVIAHLLLPWPPKVKLKTLRSVFQGVSSPCGGRVGVLGSKRKCLLGCASVVGMTLSGAVLCACAWRESLPRPQHPPRPPPRRTEGQALDQVFLLQVARNWTPGCALRNRIRLRLRAAQGAFPPPPDAASWGQVLRGRDRGTGAAGSGRVASAARAPGAAPAPR